MVRKSSSVSTAPDSLCLVTRSCLVLDSLQSHGLQPASLPCPPGFSRPEYWSGLPCPSPGDFPNPGIEPRAPALQVDSLPSEPPEKPKNTGVGSFFVLQGIFPSQGLNPGLPHCRQILHQLSHKGSPWILEWIAYPFSRESSKPRNRTKVSCMAGGFFASWATREDTHFG